MQKYEFGRSRALSKPLAAVYTQTASLLLIYFYFITNHTIYFHLPKPLSSLLHPTPSFPRYPVVFSCHNTSVTFRKSAHVSSVRM